MLRTEQPPRRLLALLVLLSTLSAPLAAQDAPHAVQAGWFQKAWIRWAAPLVALWSDGRGGCDPDGGPCGQAQSSDPLPEGRGGCDPDGGPCGSTS
ncbi:MAG TPA: hypothetical protein DD490_24245 [Acidobacteria bacterium]|nr:hypothetical protein [Acidobacteriota bacterium]